MAGRPPRPAGCCERSFTSGGRSRGKGDRIGPYRGWDGPITCLRSTMIKNPDRGHSRAHSEAYRPAARRSLTPRRASAWSPRKEKRRESIARRFDQQLAEPGLRRFARRAAVPRHRHSRREIDRQRDNLDLGRGGDLPGGASRHRGDEIGCRERHRERQIGRRHGAKRGRGRAPRMPRSTTIAPRADGRDA